MAEQARTPGSQWICQFTDSPVDPTTGYCDERWHTHCPFCGSCGYTDPCEHVLAIESEDSDGGWAISPFDRLPHLAEPCDCVWSEQLLREAFEEGYALLAHYDDIRWSPNQQGLFKEIVEALTVPVRVIQFEPADSMASSQGDDYYCESANEARGQITSIIDRLRTGFDRLAAQKADGHTHEVVYED